MSISYQSDFDNGKMDKWLTKRHEILTFFKQKVMSVLIVDPNNELPLDEIEGAFPDLFLKTFDLADCNDGNFNRIGQHLGQYINDGV